MPDGYRFHLVGDVGPGEAARAASRVFGLPADQVEAVEWRGDERTVIGAPVEGMPTVLVERDPGFDGDYVVFNAGKAFQAMVGSIPETEAASMLCAALGARAVLPAPGPFAVWALVAEDGSWGEVLMDEDDLDEGRFTVVAALQPIEGAPEIPVRPRPR